MTRRDDTTNEAFRLPYIDELIARKVAGSERATLDEADAALYEREYERLRRDLLEAHEVSRLPDAASARPALDDLLVRLRLRMPRQTDT